MKSNSRNMTRRELLRLFGSGTVALALPELLAGCGGGGGGSHGGGSGVSTASTQTVSGSVATSQIGGTGLTVINIYGSSSPVSMTGSFTNTISAVGAQYSAVTDNQGNLRALGLALPGQHQTFSAASTALALVFITPGILTTNATYAATTIASIQGLSSFANLSSYLASKLPTSSINSLQSDTTLEGLKEACVNQYFSQKTGSLRSQSVAVGTGFNASLGAGPAYPVNFTNSDPRFLSVVREYLDAAGNTLGNPQALQFNSALVSQQFGVMDGPSTIDWGSMLTLSLLTPATASDSPSYSVQGVAQLRYWIYGPGWQPSSVVPDFPMSTFQSSAISVSYLYYTVFPLIDLVLGGVSVLKSTSVAADIVWGSIQKYINVTSLASAIQNGTASEIAAAALDFVTGLLALGVSIMAALEAADLIVLGSAVTLEAISTILASVAFAFSVSNLEKLSLAYSALPNISNVTLPIGSLNGTWAGQLSLPAFGSCNASSGPESFTFNDNNGPAGGPISGTSQYGGGFTGVDPEGGTFQGTRTGNSFSVTFSGNGAIMTGTFSASSMTIQKQAYCTNLSTGGYTTYQYSNTLTLTSSAQLKQLMAHFKLSGQDSCPSCAQGFSVTP